MAIKAEREALTAIRASSELFITPAEAAAVLGCDAQSLRIQARRRPKALGFPVVIVGKRIKIPREAFLAHLDGTKKGGT